MTLKLLIPILLFTNCFSALSKQEYPQKKFFILASDATKKQKLPNKFGGLKVNKFKMSPFYDSKLFVYKLSDANLDSDYYNEFMIFPAVNITEIFSKWIFDSGIATNQLFSEEEIPYQLTAVVNSLYGDFRDKKNPEAVFEIEIFLQNVNEKKIPLNKIYKKSIKIKEANANELVKGWNILITDILIELTNDLNKL